MRANPSPPAVSPVARIPAAISGLRSGEGLEFDGLSSGKDVVLEFAPVVVVTVVGAPVSSVVVGVGFRPVVDVEVAMLDVVTPGGVDAVAVGVAVVVVEIGGDGGASVFVVVVGDAVVVGVDVVVVVVVGVVVDDVLVVEDGDDVAVVEDVVGVVDVVVVVLHRATTS